MENSKFIIKPNDIAILLCPSCQYYLSKQKCKAFPDGIPNDIFDADKTHDKLVEGQTGDFVFERAA
jgi:hypothetical protein